MALPALAPLNHADMDRFTEMAAGGLDVPVACLSLVGGDRRLLTSSYGLPAPVALLLSWSLLKRLPASGTPLLVTDGRSDSLLAQAPPVRDGMVTAYVGSRLVASDGRAVGTMCAMDRKPRLWDPSQIDFLQNLCALIVRRLEAGNRARLTAPERLAHPDGRASTGLVRRT